eukprot:185923-Pleurochrysis_carterae.AAC.5
MDRKQRQVSTRDMCGFGECPSAKNGARAPPARSSAPARRPSAPARRAQRPPANDKRNLGALRRANALGQDL